MDPDLLSLSSEVVNLKLVASGSGSIVAPATSSSASNTVVIPHNLGTTDLIWNVSANASAVFGSTRFINAPWATSDGRTALDAYIDANNLYIVASASTAGSATVGYTLPFYYSIVLI